MRLILDTFPIKSRFSESFPPFSPSFLLKAGNLSYVFQVDLKPELFSSPSSHNSPKRAQKMSVMIRRDENVEQIGEKIAEREGCRYAQR